MDIEKLIAGLSKEAYGSDVEELLLEAATALEQLQAESDRLKAEVQQTRWIPVEERLPEPTENPVLVHDYSGVSVAWHSKTMGWVYKTGLPCVDVTHWMSLPQPPKEETYEK